MSAFPEGQLLGDSTGSKGLREKFGIIRAACEKNAKADRCGTRQPMQEEACPNAGQLSAKAEKPA
ncbi:hypothetical protein, partial [Pseudomonas sp.]|uniref:hypothetical protein n=1 Tax=Pseudomonas sp. TaxID=306 RepID=UPI00260DDDA6